MFSVLSCPIARKRRLEEAEQDTERPASKRKAHPLKLALDEGFSAESDTSSVADDEAEGDGEKDEEEAGETKEEEEPAVLQNREEETQDRLTNGEVGLEMFNEEEEIFEKEEETPAAGEAEIFNPSPSCLMLFICCFLCELHLMGLTSCR